MTDLTTIEIVVLRNLIDAAHQIANSARLHDSPIITQAVKEAADAAGEIFTEQIHKGFHIQEVVKSRKTD